jgi:polar amino acid transport system substrate-binding protein
VADLEPKRFGFDSSGDSHLISFSFLSRGDAAMKKIILTLVTSVAACAFWSAGALAQDRELVVASSATYTPFAFENKDKQIVGFDIDIVNAIARQQHLKLRIVNTPFTSIFASLNNGDVDFVISGVTINDKRKQSFDFSAPYFDARQLIAVPKNSPVKSLKDLDGKKVSVVSGSTADDVMSREVGKTNPNIRRFESTPLIISELASGGVDAAIGDNGVIAYRVSQNPGLKTVEDANFPKEYYGIVVRKGDKALLDKIDAGLAAIRADGSYNVIYKKWFNQDFKP